MNNNDSKEFKENFFTLCEKSENLLQIKKLFLSFKTKQQFDNEILSFGLFAAFEKDQNKIIDLIFDFAKKMSINITAKDIEPTFNMAFINNNEKAIKYLEEKYNISSIIMEKSGFIDLSDDGKVYHGGGIGENDDEYENKKYKNHQKYDSYIFNLFEYAIEKENQKFIESIINKSIKINPSLVNATFIECCHSKQINTIVTLLSNEKTRVIIKTSPQVNFYLSEKKQSLDVKEFVKATLQKIELSEKLQDSLLSKNETVLTHKI